MADNQQMDHYDFINAPQFVDFSDLAAQDDPDADKFFETHKEEDDFMIPLDINTISPTVQLLYDDLQQTSDTTNQDDDNQHYSNEANKAVIAAGLGDVKIEYYASPKQLQHQQLLLNSGSSKKASLTSVYGTPSGGASGLSSGVTSFYTPPTGDEVEDKENATPEGNNSYVLASNKKNQQRSVLSDNVITSGGSPYRVINKISSVVSSGSPANATQSLMSRLNELSIVSSDEDEDDEEEGGDDKQKMPVKISNAQSPSPAEESDPYSTFNYGKMEFLGMGAPGGPVEANDSNVSESGDVTIVVQQEQGTSHEEVPELEAESEEDDDEEGDKSVAGEEMELGSTVKNILNKLDAELSLGEEDDEEEPNEMRCSIVVAPKIGEQVHWNSEGRGGGVGDFVEMEGAVGGGAGDQSYEVSDDGGEVGYEHLFQGGNGSILDYYGLSDEPLDAVYQTGRSSSVGDIMRAVDLEPRQRQFETYGYNPRVGITIPKTPEVRNDHQEMMGPPQQQRMNRNGCYFEVEAPKLKPVHKSVRRVSSCSDLISIQQKMKRGGGGPPPPPQKKGLTIPRTPEALKRSQRALNQGDCASSAASSVESSSSKYGYPTYRAGGGACAGPKGPSVSDRLAAARSRVPMKANHYVSMAEAMIKYQKSTPDRFRSLPRGRLVPEKRSNSCDSRNKRAPSPSTFRSPDTSISRGPTTTFGGPMGQGPVLPKRTELKPTIPRPFNLSSGSRTRPGAPPPPKEDPVDFKFKARPVPSKVLHHHDNPNMSRFKAQVKVTQPMSPHFASDARLRDRQQKRAQQKEEEGTKPQKPPTKQSRIPAATASARAAHHHPHDDHKTTVAQPFSSSFDARQKEVLRRKEDKIKQELEESKKHYEFHANPVPKYSSSKLPKKKVPEATHVEPFRLKSDERGAAYQEAFKKKLEEEQEQLKEQAQFHAQPADVIHKAPFEPERPTRVIEGPLDFQLATERRAAERENYDEHIREKEREEEERRREEQERLEELQKQEVIERRRQLVHKAQPFKDPRPFQLKSSGKPLTVPQSPAFNALPSARRVMNKSHES